MELLSLNHDVLSSIITYLSTHDGLSLASTTRKIKEISVQHTLSTITTRFRDPAHFKQFCLYVLADVKSRLHFIRRLEVPHGACTITVLGPQFSHTVDAAAVSLFVQLLERVQGGNLRTLVLYELEDVLKMDSRVEEALAALPDIVDLRVNNINLRGLELLSRIGKSQGGLHRLDLDVDYRLRVWHVFPHLAELRRLEYFDLSDGQPNTMPNDEGPEIPPGGYKIDRSLQWPAVRHLSLYCPSAPLSLYVHAFPNVRTLVLPIVPHYNPDTIKNPKLVCWPHLDHLSTSLHALKHWQLTCAVHWLELDALIGHTYYPSDDFLLVDALVREHISPVVLYLKIYRDALRDWAPVIEDLQDLKSLELEIRPKDMDDLMPRFDQIVFDQEEMFPVLASTGIVCVQIYFYIHSDTWCHDWSDELAPSTTTSFTLDADMAELSMGLAQSVPSLKYICLNMTQTFCMNKPDHELRNAWWRVVGEGEDRMPVPMTVQAGEWIRAQTHRPNCDFEAL